MNKLLRRLAILGALTVVAPAFAADTSPGASGPSASAGDTAAPPRPSKSKKAHRRKHSTSMSGTGAGSTSAGTEAKPKKSRSKKSHKAGSSESPGTSGTSGTSGTAQ
jgi:hypothetical protein